MDGRIKVTFLPHESVCPEGRGVETKPGTVLCRLALDNDIELEHVCGMAGACTTCHVHIREGGESIDPASDDEEDMLDKAWGLDRDSRLSCQVVVGDRDLVVEIPRYTVNMVSERH